MAVAGSARAAVLFDNIVSATSFTATGSTPNTFMGDGYNLATGSIDVTGFDVLGYNNTGVNYTGLKINIFVWGAVNTGAVSATSPAFSNLLSSYSLTTAGTFNSSATAIIDFENNPGITPAITLGSPLVLPASTIGLTISYQGTTDGTTYASANNLTSIISYGSNAAAAGSAVFNGYYRNANSETNGNFTSTLRTLGVTNQSLAVRIYGDASVPEPASAGGFAVAGLLLRCRRRSAR